MSDKISYVTKSLPAASRWFLAPFILFTFGCATVKAPSGPIPHTLVLGLDGISYSTFKKMQDGGHFRNFNQVQPLVASFPSISDPNWALLYKTGPEPNFTKAFFDPTIKTPKGMGGENGGLISHVAKEPVYEQIMDFKVEGVWEHLSTFIWTDTTSKYWLESLQKKFFEFSGRQTYFALIINTDLVSHTEGELRVMKYLVEIENTVEKMQKAYKERYGTDLEVILLSDHGNYFTEPQDIPFEKTLAAQGWSFPPTLSGPKDVGFYVPEMLSFGAFYCQPSSVRPLAQDFSKVPQVQSAMYSVSPTDIRVFSQNGNSEAKIIFDETKNQVDYKILRGSDPFDQIKYFKNGPLEATSYFTKTLHEPYPNALIRIWEGFNKNSKIKPQVLVNAQLGSVFGNKALRLMTDIKGFASSHGSLHRTETMGIFVSTERPAGPLRPQDFPKIVDVSGLHQ